MIKKPLIYVLEDDKSINELIVYALKSSDLDAYGFFESCELDKALKTAIPKILVLDIMLPNEDGLSVLKRLKSQSHTKDIEIILLSALDKEFDKVKGLDLGASDYITKPFSVMEFLARIRSVLRRVNVEKIISFKALSIDLQSRSVKLDDEEISLTLKEFELLLTLIKNENQCFSKESLYELIWGGVCVGRTIDIHINTLRAKLKDYAKYIKTIHGVGYRWDKNA